jgi:hypothetical protein
MAFSLSFSIAGARANKGIRVPVDPQVTTFDMAKGRSLRLADAVQYQVTCLTGTLALTRNNDVDATVLVAGESYSCDGIGVVLVYALADAQVRLMYPSTMEPPRVVGSGRSSVFSALLGRLRR